MGRRDRRFSSGDQRELQWIAQVLSRSGAVIEAAGNLDKAVRAGFIEGDQATIAALKSIVPKSRGGRAVGPEVERDWQVLVRGCLAEHGTDLATIRRRINGLEAISEREAA